MAPIRSIQFLRFITIFIILFKYSFQLTIEELYDYGPTVDKSLNKAADVSSPEINLPVPIVFYQDTLNSLFVNDNGFISFHTEVPSFNNGQFPFPQYSIIAALYSNVDIRGRGSIFYRNTDDPTLLDRANADVRRHFSNGQDFYAQSLFIATWDQVGRFEMLSDLKNTFQMVIASNGRDSYAFFFYPEDGIEWLTDQDNIPDNIYPYHAMAQAGFMSNVGKSYLLPGSGTEQVKNYPIMSNVNRKGMFAYHIGHTGHGNINEPDRDFQQPLDLLEKETCSNTRFPCVPSARCLDYPNGICCECLPGYVGNGRNCVAEDKNMQADGRITGEINNIPLNDHSSVHFFIEPRDGRVHASLNQIPPDLGYDLQPIIVAVGQIAGWMFAIREQNSPNGYTMTGGVFNRSVDILFQQTGHRVLIREQHLGLDVFSVQKIKLDIRGTLPTIRTGAEIYLDDYDIEYIKTAPGVMSSSATISFNYGQNTINIPMSINQTITFDECPNKPYDREIQERSRLRINGNHVLYDERNQLARYAFYEARMSQSSGQNPCANVRCGPHSTCIANNDDHQCVCDRGFEQIWQENDLVDDKRPQCADVDECTTRGRVCDVNAYCINEPGSYRCQCYEGYTGDGYTCRPNDIFYGNECENIHCGPNAECLPTPNLGPRCICRDGYYGDGINCQPIRNDVEDCRSVAYCDHNAYCAPNRQNGRYVCICKPGYRGNGVVCTEESQSCERYNNCGPYAECIADESSNYNHYCSCIEGYVGDGYTCLPVNPDDCNTLHNCHHNAICVLDRELRTYQCQCKPGFTGDGYNNCVNSTYVSPCVGLEGCAPNADCVFDPTIGVNVCECRSGYVGNGLICTPSNVCDPNESNSCHQNGHCEFNDMINRYECKCKPGFYGDGIHCEADENVECNIVNNCDKNASCIVDPDTLRYFCQCNNGFSGDGKTCKKFIPCNQLNSCDVKAECVQEYSTYRCECMPGFVGDGRTCRPFRSCYEDRTICDRNGICAYDNNLRDYKCKCNIGWWGDGYECYRREINESFKDHLVMAQGMSLLEMNNLEDENKTGGPILINSNQTIVAIDVDCLNGFIYYSDVIKGVINMYNPANKSSEIIAEGYTNAPEGIAIDWIANNIYWTDSFKRTVEVARYPGTMQKTLVDKNLYNPRGIAVHPGIAKIYWSDWNRDSPKIEYADLDGKRRTILVDSDLKLPNNLAIDYESNELCWGDAGLERIECINLINLQRRTVSNQANYPFDLTILKRKIYWTDWNTKSLYEIETFGGLPKQLDIPRGGYGLPYGISTTTASCPSGISNACILNNGRCKHFCFADDHGGRTCVCPDNAYHEDDTCNEI